MQDAMRNTCRMTGAGLGVLVVLSLGLFGSVGWFAALLLGVIAGAMLASFLVWLACQGTPAMAGSEWNMTYAVPPRPIDVPVAAAPRPQPEVQALPDMAPSGDAQVLDQAADRTVAAEICIYGPTDAPADDLTRIKGVGPKIAEALQEAGVTRLVQISVWDDGAIEDIATRIGCGAGRIRRDDWVGQAHRLATEDTDAAS